MSVAISVLVPVYNVEKTLDRCIQSILNQTFKDFEIILVNDGSTDNSGKLCDEYSEKYDNIRVIHKPNEGLGPTRNVGIKEAKGEFIYHCDSDDWIKEDLLEKAYKAITETDSEVLVFGYDIFTEKNGKIIPYDTVKVENGVYRNYNDIRRFFTLQYFNYFIVLSACNRLYRRSFIVENNLYFPSYRRCQDMAYSLLLFDHIEKLVTIEESFYCYVIEPGKYKGRSYNEVVNIYCDVFNLTAEYFDKWGLYVDELKQKLINNVCEQIANYSAYAFVEKYKDEWKKNAKILIKDKRVKKYFSMYKNDKNSHFMQLFSLGVHLGSKEMLYCVCKLMRDKLSKG